jgi:S1-C subfamily serine protease
MKCNVCGEEVGSEKTCPFCGSSVGGSYSGTTSGRTASIGSSATNSQGANDRKWGQSSYYRQKYGTGADTASASQSADNENILEKIAEEKTKLVDECSKAVTKIYAYGKTMGASGTGWCGYGNYIITNAHVVEIVKQEGGGKIYCEFSEKLNLGKEQKIEVDLVYYSREEDIAILLPKSGKLPYGVKVLHIEDKPTKQGELVFTIGNPLHYKFTYTEGAVANPNYKQAGSKSRFTYLQTTLTLNHGNSGGPIMNAKGDIVGMATFSENEAEKVQKINPIALLTDDQEGLVTEEINYKEIMGYGFCVKSEAILDAIKITERK